MLAPGTSLHANFLWMAGPGQGAPDLPNGGSTQQRRARFAQDAQAVAAWDFERIIPCHGDVIEKNAKKAFLDAYSKVSLNFIPSLVALVYLSAVLPLNLSCTPHQQYLGPDGKAKQI